MHNVEATVDRVEIMAARLAEAEETASLLSKTVGDLQRALAEERLQRHQMKVFAGALYHILYELTKVIDCQCAATSLPFEAHTILTRARIILGPKGTTPEKAAAMISRWAKALEGAARWANLNGHRLPRVQEAVQEAREGGWLSQKQS